MQRIILGSGLIGLLAKEVYEDSCLIPFGKSRYFGFAPPLADDFICCSPSIDAFMADKFGCRTPVAFKRVMSLGGVLHPIVKDVTGGAVLSSCLARVYGQEPPPYVTDLVKGESFVHATSCQDIYKRLVQKRMDEIRSSTEKYGSVESISPRMIRCEKGEIPFENAISTIPLDALLKLAGRQIQLKARSVDYYYIRTMALDFEGANQVLVADPFIDFFKVNKLGLYDYVFYCLKPIPNPYPYFSAFIKRFEVAAQTCIDMAIPIPCENGMPPDLNWLKDEFGIDCVGSNAQWDDFMDVSSCIKKLLGLTG